MTAWATENSIGKIKNAYSKEIEAILEQGPQHLLSKDASEQRKGLLALSGYELYLRKELGKMAAMMQLSPSKIHLSRKLLLEEVVRGVSNITFCLRAAMDNKVKEDATNLQLSRSR